MYLLFLLLLLLLQPDCLCEKVLRFASPALKAAFLRQVIGHFAAAAAAAAAGCSSHREVSAAQES